MTVYLVTTGVSLGWSRCWKLPDGDDRGIAKWDGLSSLSQILELPERAGILSAIHDLTASVLQALDGPSDGLRERALAVARQRFRWTCWDPADRLARNHLLPAELATLNLLADRLKEGDRVRIACGTDPRTNTGNLREAALVWAVLTEARKHGRLAAEAELLEPVRWAPTSSESFHAAMKALWETARRGTEPPVGLAFVLTGGYKAVILDLMKRIVACGVATSVYYLYEGETGLVRFEVKGPASQVYPELA